MSTKLLAIGNVLMEDDGIAIFLAAALEDRLIEHEIEVIYGETDISYCISKIVNGDFIIIMDAARQGKATGEVTLYSMEELDKSRCDMNWHNISMIDLLKLYFPDSFCYILAVEAAEVNYHYGPSSKLMDMMSVIIQEVYTKIELALRQYKIS